MLASHVHIQNILNGIGTLITRSMVLDHNLQKLSTGFTDFIDATGNLVDKVQLMANQLGADGMYRTMDGRYTANSIEELIHKIRRDKNESSYFDEDELDKLRRMFGDDSDEDEEIED